MGTTHRCTDRFDEVGGLGETCETQLIDLLRNGKRVKLLCDFASFLSL